MPRGEQLASVCLSFLGQLVAEEEKAIVPEGLHGHPGTPASPLYPQALRDLEIPDHGEL